jgi:hypothetical protein
VVRVFHVVHEVHAKTTFVEDLPKVVAQIVVVIDDEH